MKKIKVFLVDDHKIFRDGILSLFADEFDFKVVGIASDGSQILNKIKELKPDVLILDISMPDVSGIEVLKKIANTGLSTKVLILSMHSQKEYVVQAYKNGAKGYLPKENTSRDELIKAVRIIANGETYFAPKLSQYFTDSITQDNKVEEESYIHLLSKREFEVLQLVVEGLTNQEISEKLYVNIRTIETHKTNILQKLQLKNTVQMVKYVIQHKLLEM